MLKVSGTVLTEAVPYNCNDELPAPQVEAVTPFLASNAVKADA